MYLCAVANVLLPAMHSVRCTCYDLNVPAVLQPLFHATAIWEPQLQDAQAGQL
jgi:hypothetical protein